MQPSLLDRHLGRQVTNQLTPNELHPKPKDRPAAENPPPDAAVDQSGETLRESAPDQQPDDPRWAAMQQQMERMQATVEAVLDKMGDLEARHQAEIDNLKAEHKSETDQLKQEIADLRQEPRPASDRPAGPDESAVPLESHNDLERKDQRDSLSDDEQADVAALAAAASDGADRDGTLAQEETERSGYTEEAQKVVKSAWGVLKASGVSVPGADLVLGGKETREEFEKLPAEEQYGLMRMAETAGLAFSTMPPGVAATALGLSLFYPSLREGTMDIVHKLRRKD